MNWFFSIAARAAAREMGRSHSFIIACLIIIVWGITGPYFGYSDTWQLLINTGTTIATFLMVFLLQNSQNRDTIEVNLKLDELIKANGQAHNRMMSLERLTEHDLAAMKDDFDRLSTQDDPKLGA